MLGELGHILSGCDVCLIQKTTNPIFITYNVSLGLNYFVHHLNVMHKGNKLQFLFYNWVGCCKTSLFQFVLQIGAFPHLTFMIFLIQYNSPSAVYHQSFLCFPSAIKVFHSESLQMKPHWQTPKAQIPFFLKYYINISLMKQQACPYLNPACFFYSSSSPFLVRVAYINTYQTRNRQREKVGRHAAKVSRSGMEPRMSASRAIASIYGAPALLLHPMKTISSTFYLFSLKNFDERLKFRTLVTTGCIHK